MCFILFWKTILSSSLSLSLSLSLSPNFIYFSGAAWHWWLGLWPYGLSSFSLYFSSLLLFGADTESTEKKCTLSVTLFGGRNKITGEAIRSAKSKQGSVVRPRVVPTVVTVAAVEMFFLWSATKFIIKVLSILSCVKGRSHSFFSQLLTFFLFVHFFLYSSSNSLSPILKFLSLFCIVKLWTTKNSCFEFIPRLWPW